MLKLDSRCVTTHFRESVEYANTSPAMIAYATSRFNIDEVIFYSINWTSMGRVRASHRIGRIARTSKMIYCWLPVDHNWYKCNLATNVCPCCGATDETFEHLLACKHDELKNVRRNAYIKIQKTCDKEKLPPQFTRVFLNIIRSVLGTTDTPEFNSLSAPMAPAILSQKKTSAPIT